VYQSGQHISKSNPTTKRGSPHLRKTLYQTVCTCLLKASAQNKFLRIYYAPISVFAPTRCLWNFFSNKNQKRCDFGLVDNFVNQIACIALRAMQARKFLVLERLTSFNKNLH